MTSLRQQIATILDIPNNTSWQIIDAETTTGLYLIHYTPDASMVRYGSLKGVVVDVPHKTIVARSSGFTPVVTARSIEVAEYDNKIHLKDAVNPNVDYEIDPTTTIFYPGFDGVLFRVFLHAGHVYHSSYRKLDAHTSRWGSSSTFTEIYYELGGPADDKLFDLSKNYSPYVHIFILAHPDLQVASKTNIGSGYLVYLGSRQMWDPATSLYPPDEIDTNNPGVAAVDEFVFSPQQPLIYAPKPLTLGEVNNYLNFGFEETFDATTFDERLLPGGFVTAYLTTNRDGRQEVTGTIQLDSPAYHWRASMRDNNPNIYYQFYLLTNGKFIRAEYDDEREVYLRKFPVLTPYSEEEIDKFLMESSFWLQEDLSSETTNEILGDTTSRLYNIFLAFVYALPENYQRIAINFYRNYLQNLQDVTDWLVDLNSEDDLNHELISARARQIIQEARAIVIRRLDNNPDQDLDLNFEDRINHEIRRLTDAEEGSSLFRLMTQSTTETNTREAPATV